MVVARRSALSALTPASSYAAFASARSSSMTLALGAPSWLSTSWLVASKRSGAGDDCGRIHSHTRRQRDRAVVPGISARRLGTSLSDGSVLMPVLRAGLQGTLAM